jgi:hypothetical protein
LARTTFPGYNPKKEYNIGFIVVPKFSIKMVDGFMNTILVKKSGIFVLSRIHPKKGLDLLLGLCGFTFQK